MAVGPINNAQIQADVPTIVVNAATGTGVGKSSIFTVPQARDDQPRTLTLIPSGTFSVGTVSLLASQDNFTTSVAFPGAAADVHAGAVQFTGLIPGLSYKVTVASFTGTSVTLAALVS
jgi:hypothetical protein